MKAAAGRRWRVWALLGVLAVAGVAVFLSVASDGTKDAGKRESARTRQAVRTAPPHTRAGDNKAVEIGRVELERLRRMDPQQDESIQTGGVFAASTWYVPPPPPPPPPPLPPPQPTAPPMPFTYLGVYQEAGVKVVILSRADRVYTVPEGTVIENTYRVGHVEGGKLELIYLPLNITQYLSTGEAS